MCEKIYVKKNMGSIRNIGLHIANYLKCGESVLLKYNTMNEANNE